MLLERSGGVWSASPGSQVSYGWLRLMDRREDSHASGIGCRISPAACRGGWRSRLPQLPIKTSYVNYGAYAPTGPHFTPKPGSRIWFLTQWYLIAGQISSLAQPSGRTSTLWQRGLAALLPCKRHVWVRYRRSDGRRPCGKAKAG